MPKVIMLALWEKILKVRQEKKQLTLERRKKYNLEGRNINQNNAPDRD